MVVNLVAYCRLSDYDVYVYSHIDGYIYCYGSCNGTAINNDIDLLNHIGIHRDKGEDIPVNLEQEILSDIDRYKPLEPREN
jgi:hypothetical protein